MNILLISPTQYGIGGIAQHVQGLTKFLQRNNHNVEIISSENTLTLPIKGLKNPSFMFASLLKAKFKKTQDIVHAHNIPAAMAMKNTTGKKILTLHGIYSQQIEQLHGTRTRNISNRYEKDALSWADAITVVSKEAYEYYTDLGYNVSQIPNAIDISSLTLDVDRRYENQIIFAGRLSHEKGINLLLEIAQKLPENLNLLILGSGPEEKKVQDLARTQNNIHYLGYQSKEKTISLIRGSDVLIQSSLNEGISSTIIEGMACKIPVIATNVGGNKELIKEETGLLVDSNSSSDFIDKIEYIFSNQSKFQHITNNAFDFIQKYDWKVVGREYLELYHKLLQ